MGSREIASGLLNLELESRQLLKLVSHPAVNGRTFSPDIVQNLISQIAVLASLLEQANSDSSPDPVLLGAAQAGMNFVGLQYDLIRTDVQATARGIGGAVHRTCSLGVSKTHEGLEKLIRDPPWATRDVIEVNRLLVQAEDLRNSAIHAAPIANVMKAGVQAANIATSALALQGLLRNSPGTLRRLIDWLRGMKVDTAALGAGPVAVGASRVGIQVTSTAGTLVLTDTEVIALVQIGQLSASALSLYMMANGRPPKVPDSKAFTEWVEQSPKRSPSSADKSFAQYQMKHCGPEERLLSAEGGEKLWVDGVRLNDAHLLEAKFIGDPGTSPFVEGSKIFEPVRTAILQETIREFRRYAAIIKSSKTPAVALEVITNEPRAASYFERLMASLEIPGQVVIKP